jgi:hypothetical protein
MKSIPVEKLQSEPGAPANKFKDNSDPAYVGPGYWVALTTEAFKADTKEKQLQWIKFMRNACVNFPCKVCANHCQEYMKTSPPEDFLNVTIEINGEKKQLGMFIWIWRFHNVVNARLNKPIMSWDTAYNMYAPSNNLICSRTCLDANTEQANQNISQQTNQNISQQTNQNYNNKPTIVKANKVYY